MSFLYLTGIPNPTNSPAVDVPNMQINTNTVSDWVAVDHVGFGNVTAGKHVQVTYNQITAPSEPTDPTSIAFTKNDISGHPNNYLINSIGTFGMSLIKVMGVFTLPAPANSAPVTFGNQINILNGTITSTQPSSVGTLTINFLGTPLATGSNNSNTFVYISDLGSAPYTVSASSLVITGISFNTFHQIVILQA